LRDPAAAVAGGYLVFAANSWHHPLGLMLPSTNLHAFGGWKLTQPSQRWSPFGIV
jgi:hypothetical protein